MRYLNNTREAYWPHFTEIVSSSANKDTTVPGLILKLCKINPFSSDCSTLVEHGPCESKVVGSNPAECGAYILFSIQSAGS